MLYALGLLFSFLLGGTIVMLIEAGDVDEK